MRVVETHPKPVPLLEDRIYLIRGQKVLVDADLAALYQVETKALNRAVKRNIDRFPDDFMFQLTDDETADFLRCQFGTSKGEELVGRGGRRYRPYVFTEQGIAMLSGVLTSPRAVQVNVALMRTFVRIRRLLATHEEIAGRLERLEWRQDEQDSRVHYVFETIQRLIEAPDDGGAKRRIGFPTDETTRLLERVAAT
jgi:hypothetical protein